MAIGKKTGGRQKGSRNKATARREREIAKSGTTPLEYMLKVMRNPRADSARRDDMAKAAAPYVHPKLASLQHTGKNGGPIQTVDLTKASEEQLNALEAIFGPLATGSGDDEGDTSGEGSESL
ncbi:hypothetical protein LAV84_18335 [Rhizobium sp. VS19-DR104.2]|uniref:hypothetical protein n=1 Tax=unclassified Rhizobium TaxID=2613769 RepID=UPI001CC4BA98|nr:MULTISPECIES: hypothetical protein [unclassified Rhizobium]MBZ5761573.1 hypothetical protein [Rhizobium sp. VS19-DR96]MBZ5767521.1 hypothetical protein [Rhizobium sp. VS19-DR129.2]MBZ5775029.1 hypothetical protein [Rhizobium sp. VS19-DRK62.2]MBZ5786004.1 hypothetical protein [Rhizobium sp. VS19-DR121]MBZ5803432.1 hypothetical protein [Rhizobium sp. VS19-DR181]